jgi:hypothetical protein
MSYESIDISGMEDHFIIVDHTDNSGLSVMKPTEKDIRLFRIYGTMECGNTTHVIAYRNYIKLEQENAKLKERLKDANSMIELILTGVNAYKKYGYNQLVFFDEKIKEFKDYLKKWGSDE